MDNQKSSEDALQLKTPVISCVENDCLMFDPLTCDPRITVPPWDYMSIEHSIWLRIEGKNTQGCTDQLDILEAKKIADAELSTGVTCAIPKSFLSNLADNSRIRIKVVVSQDDLMSPEKISRVVYHLDFQRSPSTLSEPSASQPITHSYNGRRWMSDNWTEIASLKIHELLLPGAHNSGVDQDHTSWFDELWGACQDYSFYVQLSRGIRVLDLRVKDLGGIDSNKYRFHHGPYHGQRYDYHCADEVDRFLNENPGEFVILDFHEYIKSPSGEFDIHRLMRAFSELNRKYIPREAQDLTLAEIRRQYPGRNIIFAGDGMWWPKIEHVWLDETFIGEERLNEWITGVMRDPPVNKMWSLSATGNNLLGPKRIDANSPVFHNLLLPLHNAADAIPFKGNIINVDFFEGTNIIYHCVLINRGRGFVDIRPPSTPGTPEVTYISATVAMLKWAPSTGGVWAYMVSLNGAPATPFTAARCTFNGLKEATTYTVEVKARDLSGNISPPASMTFKTTSEPEPPEPIIKPGTPGSLIARNVSATSATLSWTASTGDVIVTGYLVSLNDATPIRVSALTHTFSGLNEGTFYTAKVRATDAAGNLSDPASVSFTAVTGDPLRMPRELRVTRNVNKTVRLEWNPPVNTSGLIEYKFWLHGVKLSLGNSNFHEVPSLIAGQTYTFAISAFYTGNIDSGPARIEVIANE
jgi:chitodextrinase